MNPWFLVTQLGLPEAWAAISLGMVITYMIFRYTTWTKPSPERKAFKAVTVLLVLTLILTFVSVRAIKETAQVPRPCIPCSGSLEPPSCNLYCTDGDFSFPSGHAATIFAVTTATFLLLSRRREASVLVWRGFLLYFPTALIAYSRLALGVHTLPDIAAGSLIGIASAVVVRRYQSRLGILA